MPGAAAASPAAAARRRARSNQAALAFEHEAVTVAWFDHLTSARTPGSGAPSACPRSSVRMDRRSLVALRICITCIPWTCAAREHGCGPLIHRSIACGCRWRCAHHALLIIGGEEAVALGGIETHLPASRPDKGGTLRGVDGDGAGRRQVSRQGCRRGRRAYGDVAPGLWSAAMPKLAQACVIPSDKRPSSSALIEQRFVEHQIGSHVRISASRHAGLVLRHYRPPRLHAPMPTSG